MSFFPEPSPLESVLGIVILCTGCYWIVKLFLWLISFVHIY